MDRKAVLARLERCVDQEGSQKKAADKLKVSAAYLADILNGRREPGAKMLDALNLKRVVLYEAR